MRFVLVRNSSYKMIIYVFCLLIYLFIAEHDMVQLKYNFYLLTWKSAGKITHLWFLFYRVNGNRQKKNSDISCGPQGI